ncbi:MAG: ATP-binding cassette domain-containing protein [Chloroflexi bacterium]|nr:ATP-binding cassette domain-containing protein [Chloroflexota bacterium]
MNKTKQQDLKSLAISHGALTESAGNMPIDLCSPGELWFVEQGALDVFLVEHENGVPSVTPKHILRADEGRLVFGFDAGGTTLDAHTKGLPGTKLRRISSETLLANSTNVDFADQVDSWITSFAESVAQPIAPRPWTDLLLHAGDELDSETGTVLSTQPESLTWAAIENGFYLGTEEVLSVGKGLAPLTSATWLTIGRPSKVVGMTSLELTETGLILAALSEFHRLILGAEQLNRLLLLADEANAQVSRTSHRRVDADNARRDLFGVLADERDARLSGMSALLSAMRLVGDYDGIEFRAPQSDRSAAEAEYSMRDIANVSGVRFRQIRLAKEDQWWLGDSGPVLAFRKQDGAPIALLPSPFGPVTGGRYRAVDPVSGSSQAVNADVAETIETTAWSFIRPLPVDEPINARGLMRFVGKNMGVDLGWIAVTGLLASLLVLGPAIAIGELANWVLPSAANDMLIQISVVLLMTAFIATALQMLHGTAMMRLEGRAAARGAAAVWDRLLSLSPSFVHRYTAGELASRLTVFHQSRDQVSGVVANSLLTVVFLLPTFGLMFLYDATLAWLSMILGLGSLAVTAIIGYLQIDPLRRHFEVARNLGGDLYQFINGLSKLRSAGAESSAFASWARMYRQQQLLSMRIGRLREHLMALGAALPFLAVAMLFGTALWTGIEPTEIGDFLVVYAASMIFYAAIRRLSSSIESIAAIVPAYEQVKPILDEIPQRSHGGYGKEMGMTGGTIDRLVNLEGQIRFDHVSFGYSEEGPLIIDDVSFEVRPGEFVAIVGESGSGKSTLLRLALGLEDAESGAVYYDERELAYLDRRSVRRQIGVVTQDGALKPGDILDNIIGTGSDLTIEDGWRAARLANVDAEIAAMPMGMFTPVTDSSSTFSGGQTQRVRIAAALVRRPRIVFLDEATSWLDARSQAEVMRGIESLAATRIVVAHRLSTIRKAERIFVLQSGRIVQQGRFDELANIRGPFRDLVRRQMT